MGKSLVIVESPTKIKTLRKFLGANYRIESSVGHIRDLPAKDFGIDVENDFDPHYVTLPDKKEVIERLKQAAKECDVVYLAPDPDREGEAIAWHIAAILPKDTKYQRVTFNEITKDAVLGALSSPMEIDQSLVNAQQARRLLDRIVGYKISPILHRRIKGGRDGSLSAGRVQSVALKLVIDREKDIDAFNPVEYWTISIEVEPESKEKAFEATLYSLDGHRVEKELVEGKKTITIENAEKAESIVSKLRDTQYQVAKIEKKEKKRYPVPPFITSTLQQEASRHHGFSAAKTMSVAQSLYEGMDLGSEGSEGLITYMRTDSVRSAPEAVKAVRKHISSEFGAEYLPEKPIFYTTKKSAQDAHEAIRPTNLTHPPESVERYLSHDQFKLYSLIWKRFFASQMKPAIYDTVSCDITNTNKMLFRASGSVIKFKGFLLAYEEKEDREKEDIDAEAKKSGKLLPHLNEGDLLSLLDTHHTQSFTKPPPRFTEASLVKELERLGIGRPSTFASIMNKIQSRSYTTKEKMTLKPTELGKVIAQMLEGNFGLIMDIGFTARMEDDLDEIAADHMEWKSFIKDFWQKFAPMIETAEKEAHVPKIETDMKCPTCGSPVQKIWAKNKYFFGCSNYPDCNYTAAIEQIDFKKEDYAEDFDWDQKCPKCSKEMNLRFGRFGPFLGCSTYPECRGIVNIPKKGELSEKDMPGCPAIGCDGNMRQRRSRFGKPFFSCSNFPDCDVIVNELDDLDRKYPDHPKTAYVKKKKATKKGAKKTTKKTAKKKTTKKKTTKRVGKSYTPSSELSAVIGSDPVTRPEATKKLWVYIKENDLQNPENRRQIVPDKKLEKLFGHSDPLDMMKLAKVLSNHLE